MQYEWGDEKNRTNKTKHGVDFNLAEQFEWDSAIEFIDSRFDYGENRYCALGYIGHRLYHLVFTYRATGKIIRIISLRKANKREVLKYAET
ncbi:MAG: BrnT family toxin [Desulfobacterales bacterium]|nr:BrnT family toxin [Desulfobacterales bacterium]